MKIAVIASSYVPSNAANSIQVMKVCQALQDVGEMAALWVPDHHEMGDDHPAWNELSDFYGLSNEFEVHWLKTGQRWKRYDFAWKALRSARKWGADVIYTWMPQTAYLALPRRLPVILELHTMPTGKLGPWLIQRLLHASGRKLFLPITEALRELLEKQFHYTFRQEEIQIAPMGSEPDRYDNLTDASKIRQEMGYPDVPTVAYTGHLYEGRGMELLLALGLTFPDVQFMWIGGREADVEFWRDRVEGTGAENIILTGFIENSQLPRYQAMADILLMPYGTQVGISGLGDTAAVCSPMKCFDYLSAGRAIISSDLPVLHEVLNETNAVFCPPDDIDAWEDALRSLLEDDERRIAMAKQAREDSLRYSWKARAALSMKKIRALMR
ncbi:MAG: glycosyltransferase family 4 protein [Anaerolineaceae bacterium]|nr:glycosyltransferase family 4 protein [Anaerolineaceae bacterium]